MSQGRESWDMEVIGAGHEGLAGQGKDFGSTLLSCFLLYPLSLDQSLLLVTLSKHLLNELIPLLPRIKGRLGRDEEGRSYLLGLVREQSGGSQGKRDLTWSC